LTYSKEVWLSNATPNARLPSHLFHAKATRPKDSSRLVEFTKQIFVAGGLDQQGLRVTFKIGHSGIEKEEIMTSIRFALIRTIAICLTILPMTAISATLQVADKADQVALRNVTVKDGEVSGEVVNNSPATLRDVQLQILYSWRWKDEFHPGKDDPGGAVYLTVDKEIPPGQSARFNYKPSPPLPARKDGYFDISVKVVGFTQVYR
jgi:hypothetical protein